MSNNKLQDKAEKLGLRVTYKFLLDEYEMSKDAKEDYEGGGSEQDMRDYDFQRASEALKNFESFLKKAE